jgi:hypothetical protein
MSQALVTASAAATALLRSVRSILCSGGSSDRLQWSTCTKHRSTSYHTSAYVSLMSAYVSLRQITSAYVSLRQHRKSSGLHARNIALPPMCSACLKYREKWYASIETFVTFQEMFVSVNTHVCVCGGRVGGMCVCVCVFLRENIQHTTATFDRNS